METKIFTVQEVKAKIQSISSKGRHAAQKQISYEEQLYTLVNKMAFEINDLKQRVDRLEKENERLVNRELEIKTAFSKLLLLILE
jgi:seryl-tRNA synthetase